MKIWWDLSIQESRKWREMLDGTVHTFPRCQEVQEGYRKAETEQKKIDEDKELSKKPEATPPPGHVSDGKGNWIRKPKEIDAGDCAGINKSYKEERLAELKLMKIDEDIINDFLGGNVKPDKLGLWHKILEQRMNMKHENMQ